MARKKIKPPRGVAVLNIPIGFTARDVRLRNWNSVRWQIMDNIRRLAGFIIDREIKRRRWGRRKGA